MNATNCRKMGRNDYCSVYNCNSHRMKAKETGQNVSFFSFPMGKSAKAKRRRSLWVGAIRRQGFVPTQNSSKILNF